MYKLIKWFESLYNCLKEATEQKCMHCPHLNHETDTCDFKSDCHYKKWRAALTDIPDATLYRRTTAAPTLDKSSL